MMLVAAVLDQGDTGVSFPTGAVQYATTTYVNACNATIDHVLSEQGVDTYWMWSDSPVTLDTLQQQGTKIPNSRAYLSYD